MRTLTSSLIPAALVAIMALAASPSAYAQGTPDGDTPATEEVCSGLIGSTPGLYGLCVAFCEAQDCEATLDSETGEVTFDPTCQPSNRKILEKYNERAGADGPPMPCVNVAEGECPCWTQAELDQVADGTVTGCSIGPDGGTIQGLDADGTPEGAGLPTTDVCGFTAVVDGVLMPTRYFPVSPEEFDYCRASLTAECVDRGW